MRRGHLRGLSRLIAVSRLPGLTRPTKAACSNQPLQVSVKAPIVRAITTLSRFNVGSLLVHSDGEVIGVLTERDVMRNVRPRCSAIVQDIISPDDAVVSERWPLERSVRIMLDGDMSHMPVVGMGGKVNAMLSVPEICRTLVEGTVEGVTPAEPSTLADAVEEAHRQRMASEVANGKLVAPPSQLICQVDADATVEEAVACMRECLTSSIAIAGPRAEGVAAVGLFTQRDLLNCLAGRAAGDDAQWGAPVSEHMTPSADLLRLEPEFPVFEALMLMVQRGASHLTIGPHDALDHLVGVLSMRALLKFVVEHA